MFASYSYLEDAIDPTGHIRAQAYDHLQVILSHPNIPELTDIITNLTGLIAGDAAFTHGTLRRTCITGPAFVAIRGVVGLPLYTVGSMTMKISGLMHPSSWRQDGNPAPVNSPGAANNNTPTGGPPNNNGVDSPMTDDEVDDLLNNMPPGSQRDRLRTHLEAQRKAQRTMDANLNNARNADGGNAGNIATDDSLRTNNELNRLVEEMRQQRQQRETDMENLRNGGTHSVGCILFLKIENYLPLSRRTGRTSADTNTFVEKIKDGQRVLVPNDESEKKAALARIDPIAWRLASKRILTRHIAAIKKFDVNGLIYCVVAWTASYVYFEEKIVEDTWYFLGPTCALEIDRTLRDLVATEQNEEHPDVQSFAMCDRYRDVIMAIKATYVVQHGPGAAGASTTTAISDGNVGDNKTPGGGSKASNNAVRRGRGLYKDTNGVLHAGNECWTDMKKAEICSFYNLGKCSKEDCTWKHVCGIRGCTKTEGAHTHHKAAQLKSG